MNERGFSTWLATVIGLGSWERAYHRYSFRDQSPVQPNRNLFSDTLISQQAILLQPFQSPQIAHLLPAIINLTFPALQLFAHRITISCRPALQIVGRGTLSLRYTSHRGPSSLLPSTSSFGVGSTATSHCCYLVSGYDAVVVTLNLSMTRRSSITFKDSQGTLTLVS